MATTAGAITLVSNAPGAVQLSAAPASGGAAPYTYQWYRGTSSGFTPGAGNILPGQTGLTLNDTTVPPNSSLFYKQVATDSGAVAGTSSPQAVVTLPGTLTPNSFGQQLIAGIVDLRTAHGTVSVLIDASQGTPLYPGCAVKMVDSAGGPPKVVGCTANSDSVFGFLNYDIKSSQFLAGYPAEVSIAGNAIYLYSSAPIARQQAVTLDISGQATVGPLVGSSGANKVGYAYDKATAAGQLIRVYVQTPSFILA